MYDDNNNLLQLYSTFLVLKALYMEGGMSSTNTNKCSIHLDNAKAAILHQKAHHTPAYWWRGDSDEANQFV